MTETDYIKNKLKCHSQSNDTLKKIEQLLPKSINNQSVPTDVLVIIDEYIPQPLTDKNIKQVVKDYLSGGNRKQRIVAKYGEISNWDTSRVTDMSWLFYGKTFNQPLDKWNVSNVTNMRDMFKYASSFNQSLKNWDVSKVDNMSYMFSNASSFNQSLNEWNVSNVKYMGSMFKCASSFNQSLNNWNVSKVENMSLMFLHTTFFNQPLTEWNISNNVNINKMFSFKHPLIAPWYKPD